MALITVGPTQYTITQSLICSTQSLSLVSVPDISSKWITTMILLVLYNAYFWQIRTKMGPARYSCWQMLGSCTKRQMTPKAVQKVNNVFTKCQDIRSPINPGKARTQWSTLDNRAACKIMPAATVDGAVVEQTDHLRYLGIHFNRVLTYRPHVETPGLK